MPELTPPPGGSNELPPTGEQTTGSLGRYKILDELGRGGCGVVYRALDPSIGRVVAIKTILAKTDAATAKESRERFRREARSAGVLSHPNIVTVHDFSDSGDPMFIAMEFVEGRTLAQAMSSGPLQLDFVLGVLRSAADALDYAHARHIVHRDVKPANFLITPNGRLKITDFGIAKILDGDEGLTSTGVVVGTAQYMSPEQVSEANVTGRSDQFSLAVIAYEMLSGVKPFQGNSWASVIHAIIMMDPPPISKFRDTLGDGVNAVLRKALSKDPASRFATCTEFCAALETAINGATLEGTVLFAQSRTSLPAAPTNDRPPTAVSRTGPANPTATVVHPSPTGQVPPPTTSSTASAAAFSWMPILIGAICAMVVVGAAGLLFYARSERPAAPPATAQPVSVGRNSVPATPVPEPVLPPKNEVTPVAVPSIRPTGSPTKPTKEPEKQRKVEAIAPPVSQPAPVVPVPTPTPQAPPVVATPLPPTPVPAPIPNKAQEDAKRAADEQAKRAADEQAKRVADEQAKRALDEQAKRQFDDMAKNARNADVAAISRALRDYQGAYQRKDIQALQAIWPSIPKASLEGIRGSFREASEVNMELRPTADPKVSGNTATVICDRNLHQVIMKRAFQNSGRVKIVLSRAASGWVIQSVDSVN